MSADDRASEPATPGGDSHGGPPPTIEALRASEERYRRLIEAVTDYIYTVQIEAGRPVETRHGPGCVAVTGYASEEFAADPDLWLRMVLPEDRPRVEEHARRLAAGERVGPIEHRLVRKDGAVCWVRNTPVPHRDPDGRLVAYDGLVENITDRRWAEETLQRYRLLADQARDIVLFVHRDTDRILEANQAAVAAYGYTLEELLALRIYDIRAPETIPLTAEQIARADAQGLLFETVHRRKDGSTFPVEVSSRGASLGDERVLLCIVRDITERQAATTALARRTTQLEAVREVSAEVIRELNLDRLLHLLIGRAAALVGAASATLYLWEPEQAVVVPAAWHGLGEWQAAIRHPLGRGIAGTVAQTRQGLLVNDYRNSSYANPTTLAQTQVTASLGEPLIYREELIGAITVNHEDERVFTVEDQEIVRLFAAQAAIAIVNARLHAAAVRRGAELEALLVATRSVMSGLDLDAILDRILDEAVQISGAPHVKVLLLDNGTNTLRPGALKGSAMPPTFSLPVGVGSSGIVAQTGEPLFMANAQTDPRSVFSAGDRELGIVTYLGLPIKRRDEVLGVLTFNTTVPKTYSPDELAYLTAFADQAAIAIENARLFQDEQARRIQLEAVRDVSAEVTRELDPDRALQAILEKVLGLVRGESCSIYLWDEAERLLRPHSGFGGPFLQDLRLKPGEAVAGTVAQRREGMIVNDFRRSPYATPALLERTTHTAVLAEPLLSGERLVGVITVNRQPKHGPFMGTDQASLRLFAPHAAIAIQNARLFSATQRALADLQRAQAEMVRTAQLRGLGQMAAGIAHDLNNMLATVLGQTELAKLSAPPPALRETLGLIETAATDGAAVVRRLQEFARPRGTSPLAPCDLGALVREVVEFTRPRWQDEPQRRGRVIRTETAIAADLPPILGHAPEVREALTNLIFNAVDAMPQGGTLALRAKAIAECGMRNAESLDREPGLQSAIRNPQSAIVLEVADTGVGMSTDVQAKLFEPFFTTKGVKGTGLGLSVVYGIMERHGGTIAVASIPGQGTTFTLTFQRASETCPVAAPPAEAASDVPALRLLVVDDEPLVRQTLVTLLQAIGHIVDEAADGPTALARLQQAPADVVLTDLGMPGMSGWELAGAIKAQSPHRPVLLLTGWQDQMPEDAANRQHVDAILGKPVRLEALREVLVGLSQGRKPPAPG
jgi:PAS domain S-box-containing protein